MRPDKKISMEEPNCQTYSKIRVNSAVLVLDSQFKRQSMPTACRRLLITPAFVNRLRHITDTATEPPMMEGR